MENKSIQSIWEKKSISFSLSLFLLLHIKMKQDILFIQRSNMKKKRHK